MDPTQLLNPALPFDQNQVAILDQVVAALYGLIPEQVYSAQKNH